ncbi:unnamed protein product [Bursaphelenchus okinawaensis]|uniref:Spermatogenesis-associated protein 20-like TRX domain-containing protein n=1 Tax=Bursaphelenchus okinawaensis TaxID=465554 RepID=A0A811KEA4_9BILA|nr:unnamed protein product [Bursaphelenchus okinawaensis]CAG9099588.1 unnamed protein product [Bursaphelenchus okinawaensis]
MFLFTNIRLCRNLYIFQASKFCKSMSLKRQNRLANEKSPYLLQHADNPVDWLPWGEEAFEKAKSQNKPIFLSIGYSTCHWCHVMAHESFENMEIAQYLNDNFVSIKVDREERPDVDRVYMSFVQAMLGGGGWPLSVFLSPSLAPFLGGTYFPPDDTPSQTGFLSILKLVSERWNKDKSELEKQADYLSNILSEKLTTKAHTDVVDFKKIEDEIMKNFEKSFDTVNGGFTVAPKFPEPSNFIYLFHYICANKDTEMAKKAEEWAVKTLDKMAAGGIHDHIGGGFHRYSVDPTWHVPHFEKMLYDQAQLLTAYANFCKLGHDYTDVIKNMLYYLKERLLSKNGGFYSAEDADSLAKSDSEKKKEGAFYVWTRDETDDLLENIANVINENITYGELFASTFDVKIEGNVEKVYDPHKELDGVNVLHRLKPLADLAQEFKMSQKDYNYCLNEAIKILKERRDQRPKPHRDNKVITSWNAMMISGLVEVAKTLPHFATEALGMAEKCLKFIETNLCNEKTGLQRSVLVNDDGEVNKSGPISAVADDYANLIKAYLDLFEFTQRDEYLEKAIKIQVQFDDKFYDNEGKAGYFLNEVGVNLFMRPKNEQDTAEPSYNSIAVENLLRLNNFTAEEKYQQKLKELFQGLGDVLTRSPAALPYFASVLQRQYNNRLQVLVVTPTMNDQTQVALKRIFQTPIPNSFTVVIELDKQSYIRKSNKHIVEMVDYMKDWTIQICELNSCDMPIMSLDELEDKLKKYQK